MFSDQMLESTKVFLRKYVIDVIIIFILMSISIYLVIDNNIKFIVAVVFYFPLFLKILVKIIKILMDIYQENINTRVDQVLVILEKGNYITKKTTYYIIHFDNYNQGITPFKYSGNKDFFDEDDYIEFTYLGRSNIIIAVNKIIKKSNKE